MPQNHSSPSNFPLLIECLRPSPRSLQYEYFLSTYISCPHTADENFVLFIKVHIDEAQSKVDSYW